MFKFYLGGVEIRRVFAPKKAVRGALIALDVKISDFKERLENSKYCNSTRAIIEVSEIVGEIKFMYMAGIINSGEYRLIYAHVTGQDIEEVNNNEIY